MDYAVPIDRPFISDGKPAPTPPTEYARKVAEFMETHKITVYTDKKTGNPKTKVTKIK